VKTHLRSTTGDSRLNHLMMLHVHKDRADALTLMDVANDFVGEKENRKQLFGKFSANDTPNANMADHSVATRDELHESEASQTLIFCFDYVSTEKSCFVVDLICFISLCLRVAVFLNATRRDRNLPPFTSKGK